MNSTRQGILVSSGAVERFTASDFLIGKQYRIKYRDIYPTQGGRIPGIEVQVEVVAAANEEARGYGSLPADRAAAYWSRLVRVQIQSGRIILINPEDIAILEPL